MVPAASASRKEEGGRRKEIGVVPGWCFARARTDPLTHDDMCSDFGRACAVCLSLSLSLSLSLPLSIALSLSRSLSLPPSLPPSLSLSLSPCLRASQGLETAIPSHYWSPDI